MTSAMGTPKTEIQLREQLAATMRPLNEAHTLPPHCYTSREFYELEVQKIFMKEWLGVGRVDQIENPGDYFCKDIADEPIVILRDTQGEVRAFSRTCVHRGACVVEGEGNARSFKCPFHGWTYNLDGALVGAPNMNRAEGFNRSDWPLPELRVEIWEGFIFVNFDADASPLGPKLVGLSEKFKNYNLSALRATRSLPFWNECNWKLSIEQAIDMYHVPNIHFMPKTQKRMAATFGEEDPNGVWTTSFTEAEAPYPYVTGTNMAKSPFPALEGLSSFELQSFNMLLVYPSTLVAPLPDGALSIFAYPEGPDRTNVTICLYYPESTLKIPDFDKHLNEAMEGFAITNNQDMVGARLTQRGMKSRLLRPGRFSHVERTTWEVDRYVIRKTMGELVE